MSAADDFTTLITAGNANLDDWLACLGADETQVTYVTTAVQASDRRWVAPIYRQLQMQAQVLAQVSKEEVITLDPMARLAGQRVQQSWQAKAHLAAVLVTAFALGVGGGV
jgi:hypothetical protein